MKLNKKTIKPTKAWAFAIHDGDGENAFLGAWAQPDRILLGKPPSECYTAIHVEIRPVIRKSKKVKK